MNAAFPATLDYPVATPPAPGEAIEIAPRIRWLRMPLPFALDHINLWLLADDDGTTLVDCGFGDSATRALWERHFATTLASRPIHRIIATHYHPDHLGNAAWLAQRFGAPIAMTASEYLTAHTVADASGGHTMGATVELFRGHGMAEPDLAALEARGNRYRNAVPELPDSFFRLQHGSTSVSGGSASKAASERRNSASGSLSGSTGPTLTLVLIFGSSMSPAIKTPRSLEWSDACSGE